MHVQSRRVTPSYGTCLIRMGHIHCTCLHFIAHTLIAHAFIFIAHAFTSSACAMQWRLKGFHCTCIQSIPHAFIASLHSFIYMYIYIYIWNIHIYIYVFIAFIAHAFIAIRSLHVECNENECMCNGGVCNEYVPYEWDMSHMKESEVVTPSTSMCSSQKSAVVIQSGKDP